MFEGVWEQWWFVTVVGVYLAVNQILRRPPRSDFVCVVQIKFLRLIKFDVLILQEIDQSTMYGVSFH